MLSLLFLHSLLYAADETVNYAYDTLNRLTSVEYVGKGSIHYSYDKAGDITNLTILVTNSPIVDTDLDGIDDNWEELYFGNITTISAITDFDGDGYSDLWEYLNWKEGVLDNSKQVFDPAVKNTANTRGYDDKGGSFFLMVLPAILNSSRK